MTVTLGAMDYELSKAELRQRYPDWQIWYVPAPGGAPSWHARPKLAFQAGSPDELEEMIQASQPVSNGSGPVEVIPLQPKVR